MPPSMTIPSHLVSIISVAPTKPLMTRLTDWGETLQPPHCSLPICCQARRAVQWIGFSMGLCTHIAWVSHRVYGHSCLMSIEWTNMEKPYSTQNIRHLLFLLWLVTLSEKKRADCSDMIYSWQACMPVTYHLFIFYILMHSSFVLLFFQELELEWLLTSSFHLFLSFLQRPSLCAAFSYMLGSHQFPKISQKQFLTLLQLSQPVPSMLDFIKWTWRHVSKQCLSSLRIALCAERYYTKPAAICQRSVPSNTAPEPTLSPKHSNHVCAMPDLTSSSLPDPTVSSHSLHYHASQWCRPIQEAATKLITSASPELVWSNIQSLHPNIQHILTYQPNHCEVTNSHPCTLVQLQQSWQREKKLLLKM